MADVGWASAAHSGVDPLLALCPTIAELSGKGTLSLRTSAAVIPDIPAPIDAVAKFILGIPHLRQQCERIKRAVDLSQPAFERLSEICMGQLSFVLHGVAGGR